MAELIIQTSAAGVPPAFTGDTGDLVYFLSFAVAERYGSTHDLSGAARILREQHRRDVLRPLLTFAEDNPADPDDKHDMEQIWQQPAPVATAARLASDSIRSSELLLGLTRDFPDLLRRLDDLATIADWSAEQGARIRILFRL
ncbi:MAG: hypothetical protein ACR2PL_00775 [Dehalococcoidia bacterium]